MKFFVSRQMSWPDGDLSVEIVQGGIDFANPGMLAEKWPHLGEGNTYHDPREAVTAAINIRAEWATKTKEPIDITFGHTYGMAMALPEYTEEALVAKAEELYQKLPKCDQCGELLGTTTYTHCDALDSERFCREYCAEMHWQAMHESDCEDACETDDDSD